MKGVEAGIGTGGLTQFRQQSAMRPAAEIELLERHPKFPRGRWIAAPRSAIRKSTSS